MLVADSWLWLLTSHLILKSSSFLGLVILGWGKGKSGQKHSGFYSFSNVANVTSAHCPNIWNRKEGFRLNVLRGGAVGLGYEAKRQKTDGWRKGGKEGRILHWLIILCCDLLRIINPGHQKFLFSSILHWTQWNYYFFKFLVQKRVKYWLEFLWFIKSKVTLPFTWSDPVCQFS